MNTPTATIQPTGAATGEHDGPTTVTTYDSPIGRLVLAGTATHVLLCAFGEPDTALARLGRSRGPASAGGPGPAALAEAGRQLDEYFAGTRRTFTVPVDPRLASPFARTVFDALSSVRYGGTTTYGELAGRLGRPGRARAVGSALGSNLLCVLVPCHRVLGAAGGLTGYAGGLDAKRRLLELETAHALGG